MEDKGILGIIYPPPDIKTIVDKTALFVARNGKEFEGRIRYHEKDNPKFRFLEKENPYNAYYEIKIDEQKRKLAEEVLAANTPVTEEQQPESEKQQSDKVEVQQQQPGPQQPTSLSCQTFPKAQEQVNTTFLVSKIKSVPKENPCPIIFTVPFPVDITPLDLDLIKLTAQYVARHGQSFLTNITGREHRNPQFDFLKGTHRWFQYFHSLVDAYNKIILPPKEMMEQLQEELTDKLKILDRCNSSAEWVKAQDARRRSVEEEEDKQRIAFQLVDWHDFVVVETIDFKDDPEEEDIVPTTPSSTAPLPQQPVAGALPPLPRVGPLPPLPPPPPPQRHEASQQEHPKTIKPIPVPVDDDDDEDEDMEPPPVVRQEAVAIKEDEEDENILVKTDYVRDDAKRVVESVKVIDPQTGQLLDASQVSEHMRIKTLDPKWKEQEKREREKLATTNIAPDSDMSGVLASFASRRTDIFGDVEGVLGESVESLKESMKERQKKSRLPKAPSAAESSLTPQQAAALAAQQVAASAAAEKTRQTLQATQMALQQAQVLAQQQSLAKPAAATQLPFASPHQQQQQQSFIPPVPIPGQMMGMMPPPMQMAGAPTSFLPPLPQLPQQQTPEPPSKKQKTAVHAATEFTISIVLPVLPNSEGNYNGQTVSITINSDASVNDLKEKIQAAASLPNTKFQFKEVKGGAFLKDNAILSDSIENGDTLQLQPKQRGGQKKKE